MHQLRAIGSSYEGIAPALEPGRCPALGRRWQAMVVWGIVKRTQPKRERRIA